MAYHSSVGCDRRGDQPTGYATPSTCFHTPEITITQRTINLKSILEAASIEEVHLRATDQLLNEMSYKSPRDFAEFLEGIISINLLECPAFHRYMEVKASRDIFIHNRGIVNDVYLRKAGSHQRAQAGALLPADVQYFLESYESCLQLADWLEIQLHERWHSSEFEERSQAGVSDSGESPENV